MEDKFKYVLIVFSDRGIWTEFYADKQKAIDRKTDVYKEFSDKIDIYEKINSDEQVEKR